MRNVAGVLKFKTQLTLNSFFWVSSLRVGEQGLSRRITEDLESFLHGIDLYNRYFSIENAQAFVACLDELARAATSGLRPVLHLDMHGSFSRGLLIVGSDEYIPWDLLVNKLRNINLASNNNLTVIMPACYGLTCASFEKMPITMTCPFYALVAPKGEVPSGFLEDNLRQFYHTFLEDGNVVEACKRWLSARMQCFHSEQVLAMAFGRYLKDWCRGRALSERREFLLSEIISRGAPNTRENRQEIRKRIKRMIAPSQAFLDRYSDVFLAGRKPSFTLEDICRLMIDPASDKQRRG